MQLLQFFKIVPHNFPNTAPAVQHLMESSKKISRFNKAVTYYPEDGFCCVNMLKHRKLIFYDKRQEGLKQEYIPLGLRNILEDGSFSIVNVEYQIKKSVEIEREFRPNTWPLKTPWLMLLTLKLPELY